MPIEKITKDTEATQSAEWFEKQYQHAYIDLNQRPKKPDGLFGIGQSVFNSKTNTNWVFTKGELSCISAPSKSFKSTFKSHIASTLLYGNNEAFNQWKGNRNTKETILDIDTEQGRFFAYHTFNRVKRMCKGADISSIYYPFMLRSLTPTERVDFVDAILKSTRIKNPSILFIDGIADLVEDTNDLIMSNKLVSKVMKWTNEYNIHVCCIIHNAFGTYKATGHLGSSIVKKAETVIQLEQLENDSLTFKASHQYSRGASFDEFFFTYDKQTGFLKQCDDIGNDFDKDNIF